VLQVGEGLSKNRNYSETGFAALTQSKLDMATTCIYIMMSGLVVRVHDHFSFVRTTELIMPIVQALKQWQFSNLEVTVDSFIHRLCILRIFLLCQLVHEEGGWWHYM
jgi:hypothetical protein